MSPLRKSGNANKSIGGFRLWSLRVFADLNSINVIGISEWHYFKKVKVLATVFSFLAIFFLFIT